MSPVGFESSAISPSVISSTEVTGLSIAFSSIDWAICTPSCAAMASLTASLTRSSFLTRTFSASSLGLSEVIFLSLDSFLLLVSTDVV